MAASFQVAPALVGTVLAATPVVLAIVAPLLVRCRPSAQVLVGAADRHRRHRRDHRGRRRLADGILLCLGALGCELVYTLTAVRLIRRFGTFATTTGAASPAPSCW